MLSCTAWQQLTSKEAIQRVGNVDIGRIRQNVIRGGRSILRSLFGLAWGGLLQLRDGSVGCLLGLLRDAGCLRCRLFAAACAWNMTGRQSLMTSQA